jgi:NAD(P)-dependent dehydrogenase (short-subunit alcohol dehydrogenase family)
MVAVVIITGGGGFLGQCVASALLETGTIGTEQGDVPITKLVLADIAFPLTLQSTIEQSDIVKKCRGDVSDLAFVNSLYAETADAKNVSIFHLGAVMSGDGERDFDLCMRVNLHGFMNMIEGGRTHVFQKLGFAPKFIFASAGATIGSGAPTDYITKEDTISDATRATPHTTYGATKACCELLLADYGRRGFVDGRGIRLPTIVIRAGSPNAATTSCFSSVIREPLAGKEAILPIAENVPHAVTGKRSAISAMLTLHDCKLSVIESVLGFDRTVFIPAVALSLGDLQAALLKVVTAESRSKLGAIKYEADQFLSDVVGSFPTKIDAKRAIALGIPSAPDAETLIRDYAEDFPAAIAPGIELSPPEATDVSTAACSSQVAVVTGGGSGIGRAVAMRLSKGGWAVVLAGRRMTKLQETSELLGADAQFLCVQTDVTVPQDVDNLFAATATKFGRADLLFNNAGVNSTSTSVENVEIADFERVLKTNVTGPFLCARAAMRLMAKHGGGRIINNGSISAQTPRPGSACYTTSKHALLGLTKCIALDGRASNVACGQIDFGNIVSELSRATNDESKGAAQPNGTFLVEPSMSITDAAETVWSMANLPLEANVLQMTLMATHMPFVGRG